MPKGKNGVYAVADAGMATFSVFFMQNVSSLEHQRLMKKNEGGNSAEHLFGLQSTPSDHEICNLLDPVSPERLNGMNH